MTNWTRREFGIGSTALGAAFAPRMAGAQARPRVLVVGGGIGGATVARYLAIRAKAIEVTLIEPKTRYTTCFFSNLYLAGLRTIESLTHDYATLADGYGIKVVHDKAAAIDPVARLVRLAGGGTLAYDRLVLSPGIAFDVSGIEGYDEAASDHLPHAWNGGPQTETLRAQLTAMDDGGTFVIAAPPNPFRCPPGPYERASLAAYYFKQFKPRSKILIVDSKDTFFEQDLFQDAWARLYPGMIEWLPAQFTGGLRAVDMKAKALKTAGGAFKADVANIIPPQRAGDLARSSGLADETGWCPIDPTTFESTRQPNIHVIGDSAKADDMPKSAYCANSQAKTCAFAIAAALTGGARVAPHLFNTCYTYLAGNDAISDAISFKPAEQAIRISELTMSKVGETPAVRRAAVQQGNVWYDAFTRDVFG